MPNRFASVGIVSSAARISARHEHVISAMCRSVHGPDRVHQWQGQLFLSSYMPPSNPGIQAQARPDRYRSEPKQKDDRERNQDGGIRQSVRSCAYRFRKILFRFHPRIDLNQIQAAPACYWIRTGFGKPRLFTRVRCSPLEQMVIFQPLARTTGGIECVSKLKAIISSVARHGRTHAGSRQFVRPPNSKRLKKPMRRRRSKERRRSYAACSLFQNITS